jgi:nicotinamidase-related amidase
MADTALLVVDMFNDYRHEDADVLAGNVAAIVEPLTALIDRARRNRNVDLIYVNDNHEDFTAQSADIVAAALRGAHPELVRPLVPEPGCQFVAKVRHSVFYATALDYLLGRLDVSRVILTGQVTEQCILYSALDAYVRHYSVVVPYDAVAHIDDDLGAAALVMMERNMSAEIASATAVL